MGNMLTNPLRSFVQSVARENINHPLGRLFASLAIQVNLQQKIKVQNVKIALSTHTRLMLLLIRVQCVPLDNMH
jgi:hypothetical protein